MRFAAHILALFLTITTIAMPCLAKTQVGQALPTTSTTDIIATDIDQDACKGSCTKAIVTRANFKTAAVIQAPDSDLFFSPARSLPQTPATKLTRAFKPPNPPCHHPVDLFFLCRQLN